MLCHVQGKQDRLDSRIQELETKLDEMTTHNETLEKQCNEEAKNCRFMEVPSSFHHFHHLCGSHTYKYTLAKSTASTWALFYNFLAPSFASPFCNIYEQLFLCACMKLFIKISLYSCMYITYTCTCLVFLKVVGDVYINGHR